MSGPGEPAGSSQIIPPGSTPCRELLRAVADALTLPDPAEADELACLRLRSERADHACTCLRRFLSHRENGSAEMVIEAQILRGLISGLPPGIIRPAP